MSKSCLSMSAKNPILEPLLHPTTCQGCSSVYTSGIKESLRFVQNIGFLRDINLFRNYYTLVSHMQEV